MSFNKGDKIVAVYPLTGTWYLKPLTENKIYTVRGHFPGHSSALYLEEIVNISGCGYESAYREDMFRKVDESDLLNVDQLMKEANSIPVKVKKLAVMSM